MDADEFWNRALRGQLEEHWRRQLRPRLDGLTDDEYFWSPVPDAWSVRPRREPALAGRVGGGALTIDLADPPPFTTIAWRLGHLVAGVLATRNAAHFQAPAASAATWDYAPGAARALEQLDAELAVWLAGVRGLGAAGLRAPCGPAEPYPDRPMADLVLHVHRELIHHLSEVCLLRDLHLRMTPASLWSPR
jgi:hypothetical protein